MKINSYLSAAIMLTYGFGIYYLMRFLHTSTSLSIELTKIINDAPLQCSIFLFSLPLFLFKFVHKSVRIMYAIMMGIMTYFLMFFFNLFNPVYTETVISKFSGIDNIYVLNVHNVNKLVRQPDYILVVKNGVLTKKILGVTTESHLPIFADTSTLGHIYLLGRNKGEIDTICKIADL